MQALQSGSSHSGSVCADQPSGAAPAPGASAASVFEHHFARHSSGRDKLELHDVAPQQSSRAKAEVTRLRHPPVPTPESCDDVVFTTSEARLFELPVTLDSRPLWLQLHLRLEMTNNDIPRRTVQVSPGAFCGVSHSRPVLSHCTSSRHHAHSQTLRTQPADM